MASKTIKETNHPYSELVQQREEAIKAYINANPEPDAAYCPELVIYWKGRNKHDGEYTKVFYAKSGKLEILRDTGTFYVSRNNILLNGGAFLSASSKQVCGVYFKYIPELECLETSEICNTLHRENDGTPRKWKFDDWNSRYFIFKDGTVYQNEYFLANDGKYYSKAYLEALGLLSKAAVNNRMNVKRAVKDFTGLDTYENLGHYDYTKDTGIVSNFIRYYKFILKSSKSTKSSRLIELESIELPSVDKGFGNFIKDCLTQKEYSDNSACYVLCQNINNKYFIFRGFYISYSQSEKDFEHSEEIWRLYISDNGKASLTMVIDNHIAIVSSDIRGIKYCTKYTYYNFNKETVSEFLPLKYISDIVFELGKDDELNSYYKGEGIMNTVINLLRHPIVEQLWKAGYKNVAKALCIDGEIAHNLMMLFNVKEKKNISFYTLLGVNKSQMKLIDSMCVEEVRGNKRWTIYRAENTLKFVREIMDAERISDLDKSTFEVLFNFGAKCAENSTTPKRDLIYMVDDNGHPRTFGWRYDDPYTEYQKQCIKKIINLDAKCKELNALRVFKDCLRIYCVLDNDSRPNINLYFINSERELTEVHDNLVALNNIRVEEYRRINALKAEERQKELEKKMENRQKKRIEEFEFSDGTYSIIVPKRLGEITREGIDQHHCVGGYLESVASGSTNILFLRKNDYKSESFYTIEVSNNKRVVQIHGKYNKWLGNNPEVIPFVISWLKEKNISCDRTILLSTSSHFGVGRDFLDGKQFGL